MSDNMDHYYKILGLEPDASAGEVKQAYRDLAKVWHPDRFEHDTRLQRKAQDKLKEINKAYEILSARAEQQVKTSPQETKSYNAEPPINSSKTKTNDFIRTSDKSVTWLVMPAIVVAVIIMIGAMVDNVSQKNRIEIKSHRDDKFKPTSASSLLGNSRSEDFKRQVPSRYFTIGSTKEEVLSVQGTPKAVLDAVWMYGDASVNFSGSGRVIGYMNPTGTLSVWLRPREDVSAARSQGYFTIGSTKDEVLAVQGIPTTLLDSIWMYGNSSVTFSSNGRVSGYINLTGNLKLNKRTSENRK
jgi:hypothetical protein